MRVQCFYFFFFFFFGGGGGAREGPEPYDLNILNLKQEEREIVWVL